MTGKCKFNAIYPELLREFGDPFTSRQVQVRGNLETYDSSGRIAQLPVVAFMTIRFKDAMPALTMKMNDNPEQESEFNCSYLRYEIGGERIVEFDAFTYTYFAMDQDVFAVYRANLGL